MNGGLIEKIFTWIWTPSNDQTELTEWAAGLVAILVVAFLWTTALRIIAPQA